jgi:hypothetical protein
MHGQFINSMTVGDDRLSDGFFKPFIQKLVQSHVVQLSIYILSWCHKVLLVFQENYYMLFCFDLTVHERCVRVSLMLNRFRYYKHDFRMHISKVMSIKTQYNVASFVMYLENIIIWVCSHDKYSPKKCHTLGVVNRSSCKTCSMVILPMNKHEVEHPIVIGGGDLKLFSFKDLKPFLSGKQTDGLEAQTFKYVDHMKLFDATNMYNSEHVLLCQIPIHALVFKLSILQLQAIAKQHDIKILAHANKSSIFEAFEKHNVSSCCSEYVCVLEPHCKVSHN